MIASLSKVFTAATVSAVISNGIIGGLDDDICDAIPSRGLQVLLEIQPMPMSQSLGVC
jgi:CubicO group peptidase (beta-lactamase class C family)